MEEEAGGRPMYQVLIQPGADTGARTEAWVILIQDGDISHQSFSSLIDLVFNNLTYGLVKLLTLRHSNLILVLVKYGFNWNGF